MQALYIHACCYIKHRLHRRTRSPPPHFDNEIVGGGGLQIMVRWLQPNPIIGPNLY